MGVRTQPAYARLLENRQNSESKAGYEGALRGPIHVACLHIHVLVWAFGDASYRRDVKARGLRLSPRFGCPLFVRVGAAGLEREIESRRKEF